METKTHEWLLQQLHERHERLRSEYSEAAHLENASRAAFDAT